jgi:peptidoglycan/xylan/chitin deacetylase (PgdA/CDA1 family)
LQLELDEVAFDLTAGVVRDIFAGQATPRAQAAGAGRTFKRPTLAQQAALISRLAPPVALGTRLKSAAKGAIDLSQLAMHRLNLDRVMAPRLTVLLYHRVADDARDNLTAGIEQFETDMQWVSSHCQMVSIEDVVGMARVPRSKRPLVAVTFDDGYLDNYRVAAPILRRHGVPAAFFVSTGIVNSTLPFPHDVRRKNPPLEKMTWSQLREMRKWGFTIGSHTVNHIDCAKEPEHVVRSELAQSRDDLARELSIDRPILAYPYGGRQHMTAARLELVKSAGYTGCLSAYGGVNVACVDRFNVLRRTVSHEFSALSVQRMCLGLL